MISDNPMLIPGVKKVKSWLNKNVFSKPVNGMLKASKYRRRSRNLAKKNIPMESKIIPSTNAIMCRASNFKACHTTKEKMIPQKAEIKYSMTKTCLEEICILLSNLFTFSSE